MTEWGNIELNVSHSTGVHKSNKKCISVKNFGHAATRCLLHCFFFLPKFCFISGCRLAAAKMIYDSIRLEWLELNRNRFFRQRRKNMKHWLTLRYKIYRLIERAFSILKSNINGGHNWCHQSLSLLVTPWIYLPNKIIPMKKLTMWDYPD